MRKENKLPIPRHDIRSFTWFKGSGTTEASTLGARTWGRMYKDACDVGFTIANLVTGVEHAFYMVETIRSEGWSIAGWTFESSTTHLHITVWND